MILRLGPTERSDVVDVLTEAFFDYPVMRYVLGHKDAEYERRLRLLIGGYVDHRLNRGSPVLGVAGGGDLVAAALVDEPFPANTSASPLAPDGEIWSVLGRDALRRVAAFEERSAHLEPDFPHYFIGMIGVRVANRGTGLARGLIQEVVRLSREDPSSEAVSLSTESPGNIAFYEQLGFEVTAEAQIGELHTWNLVLPTS